MKLRFVMVNESRKSVKLETSQIAHDPLIIKGPDGNTLPYMDVSYQTMASYQIVDSCSIKVLFNNYDMADQYHIVKPGQYIIQLRDRRYPNTDYEILKIEVQPGKLSPLQEIVEALMPIVPKNWKLIRHVVHDKVIEANHYGDFIIVVITDADNRINLSLFINPTKSGIEGYHLKNEIIGQSKWGPVYFESLYSEQQLWPDCKKQIMNALGVNE